MPKRKQPPRRLPTSPQKPPNTSKRPKPKTTATNNLHAKKRFLWSNDLTRDFTSAIFRVGLHRTNSQQLHARLRCFFPHLTLQQTEEVLGRYANAIPSPPIQAQAAGLLLPGGGLHAGTSTVDPPQLPDLMQGKCHADTAVQRSARTSFNNRSGGDDDNNDEPSGNAASASIKKTSALPTPKQEQANNSKPPPTAQRANPKAPPNLSSVASSSSSSSMQSVCQYLPESQLDAMMRTLQEATCCTHAYLDNNATESKNPATKQASTTHPPQDEANDNNDDTNNKTDDARTSTANASAPNEGSSSQPQQAPAAKRAAAIPQHETTVHAETLRNNVPIATTTNTTAVTRTTTPAIKASALKESSMFSNGQRTFMLPHCSSQQIDSNNGIAMGHLIGLYFSLYEELCKKRQKQHRQRQHERQRQQRSSPEPTEDDARTATTVPICDSPIGQQPDPPITPNSIITITPTIVESHSKGRRNLEASGKLNHAMECQQAFRHRLHALKQHELSKYARHHSTQE